MKKVISKLLTSSHGQTKTKKTLGFVGSTVIFYTNPAPEELRAMRERIDKRINHNIAETFGVGIIVLELATFIGGD